MNMIRFLSVVGVVAVLCPSAVSAMEKGDCVKTSIARISPYFADDTAYDSGIVIELKNGITLIDRLGNFNYNELARIDLGVGDKVTACLQYTEKGCPRDLTPQKVYHIIDKTSGRVFDMGDHYRMCY